MTQETHIYVLRKGKEVIISSPSREVVLNEKFLRGGEVTKEIITVKIPTPEPVSKKRW